MFEDRRHTGNKVREHLHGSGSREAVCMSTWNDVIDACNLAGGSEIKELQDTRQGVEPAEPTANPADETHLLFLDGCS